MFHGVGHKSPLQKMSTKETQTSFIITRVERGRTAAFLAYVSGKGTAERASKVAVRL